MARVAFTELATLAGTSGAGTALTMGNTCMFLMLFLTPLLSIGSWPMIGRWQAPARSSHSRSFRARCPMAASRCSVTQAQRRSSPRKAIASQTERGDVRTSRLPKPDRDFDLLL